MKNISPRLLSLAFAASLTLTAACASGVRHVRVLQTTDVHGAWSTRLDAHGKPLPGGAAQLAGIVAKAREDSPVLLVDSGDLWSGTLLADRNEGKPGIEVYNVLGYDAAAVGNHDFDYGPVGTARRGADPFGALEARLREAKFPLLAANLRDRKTGKLPAWDNLHASVILTRGGFKVGVIGVITTETPGITFPYVGQRLEFLEPAPVVRDEAARLRAQEHVDLVLVLAHLGGECHDFSNPDDVSSCHGDSELFTLARALPAGSVDAIFGGHTHRQVAHRVNGIALLQAGAKERAVAALDIRQLAEGRPVLTIQPFIPVQGPTNGALAKRVAKVLAPYESEVTKIRAEDLGARVARPLTRQRGVGSDLGSFLCDALLAKNPSRNICLLNAGGLRANIAAGPLTYGALYDALPFGNRAAYAEVPGRVLREILRAGTTGAHGVVQVGGLDVAYDRAKDHCPTVDRNGDGHMGPEDRDRLVTATLADGKPIDPAATYHVITSSFLASGGDGYGPLLAKLPKGAVQIREDDLPMREQVAAWVRATHPLINSADNPVAPKPRVRATGVEPTYPCPALKGSSKAE